MSKIRDKDQAQPLQLPPREPPDLSRRELLIRTGQVALVIGSTEVFTTLLAGCGSSGSNEQCVRLKDKQGAFYNYCYETYKSHGHDYGHYVSKAALTLAAPRYQRSE